MILPSNKLTDRFTGVAVEFLASDVPQALTKIWRSHGGLSLSNAGSVDWINDGGSPQGVTLSASTTGTVNWLIPSLQKGQFAVMYNSHFQNFSGNSFIVGDSGNSSSFIKVGKRNAALTTNQGNSSITFGTDPDVANGQDLFYAGIIDLANPIDKDKFYMIAFDPSGVILSIYKDSTLSGSFSEEGEVLDFNNISSPANPFSTDTGNKHYSSGMVYFNQKPNDLMEGLVSMAQNPETGCYDLWR